MTSKFYRGALILVAFGAFVSMPILNAQPSLAGNVEEAIKHAKEAVDHGKQGHAEALVTHAESRCNMLRWETKIGIWMKGLSI